MHKWEELFMNKIRAFKIMPNKEKPFPPHRTKHFIMVVSIHPK